MVTVYCHPTKGAWHEMVMPIVNDNLGVSRDEFNAWLRDGGKGRRKD